MKVILFNGDFQLPSFIHRLANELNSKHEVIIVGFSSPVFSYHKDGIQWASLGDNRRVIRFIFRTLILLCNLLILRPGLLIKSLQHLFLHPLNKRSLSEFNLSNTLHIIQPDIIHIQWASHLKLFRSILDQPREQRPRVIVSLRGRLVNVSPYVNPGIAQLYQEYFPKVDGIHAVSKAISLEAKRWGAPDGKIRVIYSGINTEVLSQYRKTSWQLDASIQVILVGRHHWIKGYHYALDTLRQLVNNGMDIHYTIIGGIAPEDILYQIQDLGLDSRVCMMANLPQKEVFRHMQQSDILLLSSVAEGIANVVLEAMAIGLPVVSSDCGGMKEVIEDGLNGFLFESRNAAHMADQIKQMINMDPEQRRSLALAAQTYVYRHYGVERLGSEMAGIYQ